jgi:hypothetical protein
VARILRSGQNQQEVPATVDKASSQFDPAGSGNPMVIAAKLQGTFNAFARIGKARPRVAASALGIRRQASNM